MAGALGRVSAPEAAGVSMLRGVLRGARRKQAGLSGLPARIFGAGHGDTYEPRRARPRERSKMAPYGPGNPGGIGNHRAVQGAPCGS